MNCFDCAPAGLTTPAVAVCHECGSGICADHAIQGQHILTVAGATNWQTPVDPKQRRILCHPCAAVIDAADELSAARRTDHTVGPVTGPGR